MQVTIQTYSTGINNKIDSASLSYNQESGIVDLETADDILIDRQGGIVSARGNSIVSSGDYHSGFPTLDGSFFAAKNRTSDTSLYKITPQPDGTVVVNGMGSNFTKGARFSWCEVDGEYFFMNGYEKGRIVDHLYSVWPTSEWPRETEDVYLPTPTGKFFDIISGCFVLGSGKEVIWTESGIWGIVNENTSWERFESDIRMIYSVETGVYISDSEAVYWCAGTNPREWNFRKVLNYPAIPYKRAASTIDPSFFGFQTSNPSALFGTVNGPVVGLPDGSVFNLVDKKVIMPKNYRRGGLMIVDETMIILSGV